MELKIQLPKTRCFDIELDKVHFHSAYTDQSKMIFLTQGEHIVSVSAHEPSMLFWGKTERLINLFSQGPDKCSAEFMFNISMDVNTVVSVEYGNYSRIDFICDEELSAIL